MGATIERGEGGVWVVRISGRLQKSEMDAVQDAGIKGMDPEEEARVLVVVENDFCGWAGSEVWNDMTFFVRHGDRIVRIAIVGDAKWETEMMMFTAAGLRRAKVKYFGRTGMAEACLWLEGQS